MGVSLHYWSMPPSSVLFERLQTEGAFVTLMGGLFCYGSGIFFFFDDLSSAAREEILQNLINGQQKLLGPEPIARRLMEEFRQEGERTRLSYAGVEQRRCSLEKTGSLMEERLAQALKKRRDDAATFVGELLHGDQLHGTLKEREFDIEGLLSTVANM